MEKNESMLSFYQTQMGETPSVNNGQHPFRLFDFADCLSESDIKYRKRDFFKIALMKGDFLYHFADRTTRVSGSNLMFFSPDVPYRFEVLRDTLDGYFCIFQESFYTDRYKGNIRDLPMFGRHAMPCYELDQSQDEVISQQFLKMKAELDSDYTFKYDLVRDLMSEMIHFALKMQPSENVVQNIDANARIASIFKELLERQFPIESHFRFKLRSAMDFADAMAMHVNHLNRALKLSTGKTTTHHISERIVKEAKVLLKHSAWNVSEISFVLGFEDVANFTHFFKKHTDISPTAYRN